jgi:hypothetical protein
LSDLNGVDPKAHNNNHLKIIDQIRNWLLLSGRKLPGPAIIKNEFNDFYNISLPAILQKEGLYLEDLAFRDFCLCVEEWLSISKK